MQGLGYRCWQVCLSCVLPQATMAGCLWVHYKHIHAKVLPCIVGVKLTADWPLHVVFTGWCVCLHRSSCRAILTVEHNAWGACMCWYNAPTWTCANLCTCKGVLCTVSKYLAVYMSGRIVFWTGVKVLQPTLETALCSLPVVHTLPLARCHLVSESEYIAQAVTSVISSAAHCSGISDQVCPVTRAQPTPQSNHSKAIYRRSFTSIPFGPQTS